MSNSTISHYLAHIYFLNVLHNLSKNLVVILAPESAFDLKTVHPIIRRLENSSTFRKMCACVQNSYTLVSVGLYSRLNIKLQINSQIFET